MQGDLLGAVKGLFTEEYISIASTYFDDKGVSVKKAMNCLLPVLLIEITHIASSTHGANRIMAAAQDQKRSGTTADPMKYLAPDGGSMLNKGAILLTTLFGDRSETISKSISDYAGITTASATTLSSISLPVIFEFLGTYIAENDMNPLELAAFLKEQFPAIEAGIPKDSGIIFLTTGQANKNDDSRGSGKRRNDIWKEDTGTDGGVIKEKNSLIVLGTLFLLVLIIGGYLYFSKSGGHQQGSTTNDSVHYTSPADVSNKNGVPSHDSIKIKNGSLPAGGDTVIIELPDNNGTLRVGRNSTEANLVTFLQDQNAFIDTVNGNWFDFTGVSFKPQSALIAESSLPLLQNFAAITRAFPAARFKIGSNISPEGATPDNIALSQKRVQTLLIQLFRYGASPSSLFIAGNKEFANNVTADKTKDEPAMNGRIGVKVTAK